MKPILLALLLLMTGACTNKKETANEQAAKTGIEVRDFPYRDGALLCQGFVALPDSKEPAPAVLIVPEWWGIGDYEKSRARQLAELGFVAFVVDMYGEGRRLQTPDSAGKYAAVFYSDVDLAKNRFLAAYQQVKSLAQTDTNRIGAIGYCFGGTQVLNMARMGLPLQAVVSFHGNLRCAPIQQPIAKKAAVLVCNGAADGFVSEEDILQFKQEMQAADFAFTFTNYADAKHAFTNPEADQYAQKFNMDIAYNPLADSASWVEMKNFLEKNLMQTQGAL